MLPRLPALLQSLAACLPALLPGACALCGGAGTTVCTACQARFFGRPQERCRQCALPLAAADALCGACLAAPPAFDAVVAATDYAAPADSLVLDLKFGARLAYAPALARLLHAALRQRADVTLPELLAPVPLGRNRLAERGYNQALEIARPLAAALGIALAPRLLFRWRDTEAQSALPPGQRQRNVQGAFGLQAHALDAVRGRHIGLVDDVMTTGATLQELAALLKRHGAARVTGLVFARTPPH